MAWHLAPRSGDLQGRRFLVAGIIGNVALAAYGGGIRRNDQAPFSAANIGLKLRRGEGDVREAGEEGNVSECDDWSGRISIFWNFCSMECKEGLLHNRRLMESAIKFGRKDGISCVCDVTE